MKLGGERQEGLGRVEMVAREKRNGLQTLLFCLGTSSSVKKNSLSREKFALCRKHLQKANSLESLNMRISQGDEFGICRFGMWDLLPNFLLECIPNVHTKFATLKFCEEKIQPSTASNAITLETDGQISVVQNSFVRTKNSSAHRETGIMVWVEKVCMFKNQDLVVNSGFQKKK